MASFHDPVEYSTYADYVAALARFDPGAYTHLASYFKDVNRELKFDKRGAVHPCGRVFIADLDATTLISRLDFAVGEDNELLDTSLKNHVLSLDRIPGSTLRLIVLSYFRNEWHPDHVGFKSPPSVPYGIDKALLDALARRYKIHPELLIAHFGEPRQNRSYIFTKEDWDRKLPSKGIQSIPSNRKYFEMVGDELGIARISAQICDEPEPASQLRPLRTVIMIACNDCIFPVHEESASYGRPPQPDDSYLLTRIASLGSELPDAASLDSAVVGTLLAKRFDGIDYPLCSLYGLTEILISRLATLSVETIQSMAKNPMEVVIPYAEIYALRFQQKFHRHKQRADFGPEGGFEAIRIYWEKATECLLENKANLQAFLPAFSSPSAQSQLRDMEYLISRFQRQETLLRERMNYRASMASLQESRAQLQQNSRVKILTQLAFIFIPLSFISSVFGMNIDVLDTGPTRFWVALVSIPIVYLGVAFIWFLINIRVIPRILDWIMEPLPDLYVAFGKKRELRRWQWLILGPPHALWISVRRKRFLRAGK